MAWMVDIKRLCVSLFVLLVFGIPAFPEPRPEQRLLDFSQFTKSNLELSFARPNLLTGN